MTNNKDKLVNHRSIFLKSACLDLVGIGAGLKLSIGAGLKLPRRLNKVFYYTGKVS